MRSARHVSLLAVFAALAGCDPGNSGGPPRYALQASGGAYDDGSGRLGVAMLVTLRDAAGTGPLGEWTGTLSDGSGSRATVAYADASAGSCIAAWWPDLAFSDGDYRLALAAGDDSARTDLTLGGAVPLAVPDVRASADGAALEWDPVPGAAAYGCRMTGASGTVRTTATHDPSCPLGDLPDDGYSASVQAYSADLALLSTDIQQRPALPERFDVAEGRLSFVREGAATVAVVAAAGGAIDYGLGVRTLATWLAIRKPDGSPTASTWQVAISGPGIPAGAPLRFAYPASFSQRLVWSYDQPAAPGLYAIAATSGELTVQAQFSVGEPAILDAPVNVTALGGAQGAAGVDWMPVAGARSYIVGVWQGAEFVTSQWVAAPPASFPQGTFTPGQVYDVYVAATDADLVSGAPPLQVAVTENTLQPAGFVAR